MALRENNSKSTDGAKVSTKVFLGMTVLAKIQRPEKWFAK